MGTQESFSRTLFMKGQTIMETCTINARAKINLTLEIFDKRKDGYHDMRSVMHKIELCDIVKVTVDTERTDENAGEIRVSCSKAVCEEKDNLAYKAADRFMSLYYKKTGKIASCIVEIEKIIPEKAGLGGGSADCAAVLDALTKLLGVISEEEKEEIAAELGSDVPFMLEKYDCALATGTGTMLQSLPMMPMCYCVIGTPDKGLSTRDIYDLFDDKKHVVPNVKVNSLISALEQEDFGRICDNITNQFEPICIHEVPEIGKIKKCLLKNGAYTAQMSGSGSAVFGIFTDKNTADTAYEALSTLPFNVRRSVCKI